MKQKVEEEKKEAIGMKKSLALKTSSHQEASYSKELKIEKRKQFQQNRFKGDFSRSNKFLQPAKTQE